MYNHHSYHLKSAISKITGGSTRCLLGRTSWNIGEACVILSNHRELLSLGVE